ncbi:hypothetical protein PR202_ga28158 [Eleusine coracana subsp. coracana]|uniref:RRM domain-containing protein n=1 Tax=Eleusine coracana subsp. coracana TaxID=191504 RepID=A0AAV5DGG2_ELECO|nr:hypothetical protein PR202_ga28158 [Eleusine coracana subsp. coracana]
MKLLKRIGVENINSVMLKADPNKPGYNHGYAHLELETTTAARVAYKKLSKKGAFGKWLITVQWATPSNGPDEKDMQKVKSVFVEGVPNSWGRDKMTEIFKKYGMVEHVVLSCDMHLALSTDIAYIHYTTREAAILCVQSFDGQELSENDSKVSSHIFVNIKVSLAKPFRKGTQNKDQKLSMLSFTLKYVPHP